MCSQTTFHLSAASERKTATAQSLMPSRMSSVLPTEAPGSLVVMMNFARG